jgi:hypothetical protein
VAQWSSRGGSVEEGGDLMDEESWLSEGGEVVQCKKRVLNEGGKVAQWRRRSGSIAEERWLNGGGEVAQCNRRGGSVVE